MSYDPLREPGSIWAMLAPGTHTKIASVLSGESRVQAALRPVFADPSNRSARTALVKVVVDLTGNCLGHAILHEKMTPSDDASCVYRALHAGVRDAIVGAIDVLDNNTLGTEDPGTNKDSREGPVFAVSRYAGRCVGQAIGDDLRIVMKKLLHL